MLTTRPRGAFIVNYSLLIVHFLEGIPIPKRIGCLAGDGHSCHAQGEDDLPSVMGLVRECKCQKSRRRAVKTLHLLLPENALHQVCHCQTRFIQSSQERSDIMSFTRLEPCDFRWILQYRTQPIQPLVVNVDEDLADIPSPRSITFVKPLLPHCIDQQGIHPVIHQPSLPELYDLFQ